MRPRCSWEIFSRTTGSPSSRTVMILTGMTRSTRPTVPRCWNTLQRKRPRPGTEYAMSISRLSLNFCFWRLLMTENAMAMVSSCISRLVSTSGTSSPLMRRTGWDPTFRWRSDALRSEAIFRRSFICMSRPIPSLGRGGCAPARSARGGLLAHERQPAELVGNPALDHVEEGLLQGLGDGAARPLADHDLVHRPHGG